MHGVAAYPLYWPPQHPRTPAPMRRLARFMVDFLVARNDLLRQLVLLGASDILISSNIPLRRDGLPQVPDRQPDDPGVAVYFMRARGREGDRASFVVACDQFATVRWNLRAIGATLEALRSIERHGTTSMLEQAFSGFAALPASTAARKPWREVLGVPPGPVTAEVVRAAWRELARVHHPDRGGDVQRMAEINDAYDLAQRELGSP